jgi:hypothetical protein
VPDGPSGRDAEEVKPSSTTSVWQVIRPAGVGGRNATASATSPASMTLPTGVGSALDLHDVLPVGEARGDPRSA